MPHGAPADLDASSRGLAAATHGGGQAARPGVTGPPAGPPPALRHPSHPGARCLHHQERCRPSAKGPPHRGPRRGIATCLPPHQGHASPPGGRELGVYPGRVRPVRVTTTEEYAAADTDRKRRALEAAYPNQGRSCCRPGRRAPNCWDGSSRSGGSSRGGAVKSPEPRGPLAFAWFGADVLAGALPADPTRRSGRVARHRARSRRARRTPDPGGGRALPPRIPFPRPVARVSEDFHPGALTARARRSQRTAIMAQVPLSAGFDLRGRRALTR